VFFIYKIINIKKHVIFFNIVFKDCKLSIKESVKEKVILCKLKMVTKTGLVKVICHQKMPSNNKVSKLMQII